MKMQIAAHQIFDASKLPDMGSLVSDLQTREVVITSADTADAAREAWIAERLGKITGSKFGDVKRAKGGSGWSEGAETYLSELIWEHVTGIQASDFSGSKQTEWGEMHEAEARRSYEKITGNSVVIGVFYPLEGFDLVGCTPDGVGQKGLEIKCPYAAKAHLSTILKKRVPSDYIDQVTGHILVTKKDGCDFVSYEIGRAHV